MFVIQVGVKTQFKYDLQGLLVTERIYQSLSIKCLVRRRFLSEDINTYNHATTRLAFL